MASLSDKIGTRLAGRYELQRELGQGGMATAYLAHDGSLNCPVVIKSPHAALLTEPTFTRRFQQEMRSLVKLSHPHIVKITDVGEHEGLPFFVMQFLGGGSLRDRQGSPKTRQPADQLRDWLTKIAEALDFMHDRGYVHRDVKPANILFDEHGHAYLSDFGVAKAVQQEGEAESSSSLTGTGMVLGTPDYLAPEVILGEKSDGRADQYALAITVYELLGGRCPFAGPTPTAVMVQHSAAKPKPLKQLVPALAEALCNAVHRGLAKKPQERYGTCREFADAVIDALNAQFTTGVPNGDNFDAAALAPQTPSPETPRADCPQCGKSLKLPAESSGRIVACPSCQARLTVSLDGRSLTASKEISKTVAASIGLQRTTQLSEATPPSATSTALLTLKAWYRMPSVQATLVGLVLVVGILLGAIWRGNKEIVDAVVPNKPTPSATPHRLRYIGSVGEVYGPTAVPSATSPRIPSPTSSVRDYQPATPVIVTPLPAPTVIFGVPPPSIFAAPPPSPTAKLPGSTTSPSAGSSTSDDQQALSAVWAALDKEDERTALSLLLRIQSGKQGKGYWKATALVHDRLGNVEGAYDAYLKAIELAPDSELLLKLVPIAMRLLGNASSDAREREYYKSAMGACETAIRLDPMNSEAFNYLGVVQEYGQDYGNQHKAVGSLNTAIAFDPNNLGAWYNLAKLYQKRKDYAKAVAAMQEALKRINSSKKYRFVSFYGGDFDSDKEFTNVDSIELMIHLRLGASCNDISRYPESIEHFQRVLEIESKNVAATWGICLAYRGWRNNFQDQDALEWERRAKQLNQTVVPLVSVSTGAGAYMFLK